jgi:glycosyltransferase involved in cell wall biosynthesis
MLSVILPSYNHAAYLGAALAGLLSQTRPADEIFVIDDASTDDSLGVAELFAARHRQITVVRNACNLGCVANLNRGLAMARGDIVYCGAADDVTYRRLFELGISLLEAHPQAGMFSARSDIIDATGARLGIMPTPLPRSRPGVIDSAAAARFLMREDGWFMGNTALYRRSALVALGGFPEDLGSLTDGYVSRLLALRHGACFSPEILAAWRRLEGGYAWSETVAREQRDRVIAAVLCRIAAETPPFPPGYGDRWQRRFIFGASRFGLREAQRQTKAMQRRTPLLSAMQESAMTVWLFFRLRPWDALPVARRYLRYAVERRRLNQTTTAAPSAGAF